MRPLVPELHAVPLTARATELFQPQTLLTQVAESLMTGNGSGTAARHVNRQMHVILPRSYKSLFGLSHSCSSLT